VALSPLPIDEVLPDLLAALERHRAAVLQAPPGAGKTTRVPVALLDAGVAGDGLILVLEPRRVAARAAARRMAQERGEAAGQTVGYQVRFEEKRSQKTRVLVVTEGLLTRRFLDDPTLDGVSCVILDEVHERNVHTDLCLAMTRELLEVREDLRVVVMSATIDAAPLATFLDDAPIVTSEGRAFPLAIRHAERPDDRRLEVQVRAAVHDLMRDDDDDGGDVLVFLPGAGEIRRCADALQERPPPGAPEVLPLYGALSPEQQDRALTRGTRRRVVLATNLAETSLTLEGVTTVVDSGLQRLVRYSPRTGLNRLETARISRWSADQRAGRAGRTAPGRVLRLWTKAEDAQLSLRDPPELMRTDLAPVLLQTLAFQPGAPLDFPFFEPPPDAHVQTAMEVLRAIGALEDDGERLQLAARGRTLAALPVHPRTGAMLLEAARLDQLHAGATFAAVLEGRDLLLRDADAPFPDETSDLEVRTAALEELEACRFARADARALGVDVRAAREAVRVRDQLLRLARRLPKPAERASDERAAARVVLAGFPDRLCEATGERAGRMTSGRGVALSDRSLAAGAAFFVALDVEDGRGARSRVRVAHPVEADDVRAALAHLLEREESAELEGERGTVVGVVRERVGAVVLAERRGVRVSQEVVQRVLGREAEARFEELFQPDDDCRRLIARVRFAAEHLPGEDWPALDDDFFRARLRQAVPGARTLAALRALDWREAVLNALPWKLRSALEEVAPERVEVPSGSKVRLDWEAAHGPEGAPILAVRLQEVFGWTETPRVARGRVPLLLHLLAPNRRPAAVTSDLASFWANAYADVRKDLRARYPKHSWPEDPASAPAQRRPQRRKR
jgi:ATP-dependent helicase HrpB